jgi:hypothetical protein
MCVVNSSNKEEKINLSTFNEITSQNKILLDVLNRQTKNIDQNPIAIHPVSFQIFELK